MEKQSSHHMKENRKKCCTRKDARFSFSLSNLLHKYIRHREQGNLNLAVSTSSLEVNRQYLYDFVGDLKTDVFFFTPSNKDEHLKFFHSLEFKENDKDNTMTAHADHLCIKDLYQVEMRLDEDTFEMRWAVKGPRKDNLIITNFKRSNS